jgi:hypothetical protein
MKAVSEHGSSGLMKWVLDSASLLLVSREEPSSKCCECILERGTLDSEVENAAGSSADLSLGMLVVAVSLRPSKNGAELLASSW